MTTVMLHRLGNGDQTPYGVKSQKSDRRRAAAAIVLLMSLLIRTLVQVEVCIISTFQSD